MSFSIIAALARDGAIGVTRDGIPGLPWPTLRQDMAFFSRITQAKDPLGLAQAWCTHVPQVGYWSARPDNAVIMGRRTWESLGGKPLAHRTNIVLRAYSTYGDASYKGSIGCCALETALYEASEEYGAPHTFVIGGASVYAEALRHPACERLYLTLVDQEYPEADTHFPQSDTLCWETGRYARPIVHEGYGDHAVMSLRQWHRTACSAWITEPERPRYRFTLWERA